MQKITLLLLGAVLFSCNPKTHCTYKLSVEYYEKPNDTIIVEAYSMEQDITLKDSVLTLGKYFRFKTNVRGYSVINKECDSLK